MWQHKQRGIRRCYPDGFDDEGTVYKPRSALASGTREDKEVGSLLAPPEGAQPC